MIGKIKRGQSFKGVCAYVLKQDKQVLPKIIGGNMCGVTPIDLAREFEMIAALNSRVKMTVKHFSIAFAPEDGDVADEVKCALAAEYMERMGYGSSQYIVVSHDRTDHQHDHDHIHLVANAVAVDGTWVSDWMNWKQSQTILRDLERQFQLTPVVSSWDKNRNKSAATRRDRRVERLLERGMLPSAIERTHQNIQAKISQAAPGSQNIAQFCARLQSLDVVPIPRITRTGKVQGISYQQGKVVVRGSDLVGASFPELQSERGLVYDPAHDLSALKRISKGDRLAADGEWLERLPSVLADLSKSEPKIFIEIPETDPRSILIEIPLDFIEVNEDPEVEYEYERQIPRGGLSR